ncbi:MAG: nucleotide exchange factor GrpE [Candidatus Methylacidiphilales bacterium]
MPNDSHDSTSSSNTPPGSSKYELVDAQSWQRARAAAEEITQLREKATRLHADLENSRRRLEREKEETVRYANSRLLEELLPVVDNFELGLSAAESASDPKSILLGMQMVKTQLQKFLEDQGIQTIDARGAAFDPNLHEAVSRKETTEHPDGTVVEQIRKGYKLGDRLIRPASVVVAHSN